MRWKKKQAPKHGDIRIIKKFLLFPKCLSREYRWLEYASIRQECHLVYSSDYDSFNDYIFYEWVNIGWVD